MEEEPYVIVRGDYSRPGAETTTFDPFVTEMLRNNRNKTPDQDNSGKNFKFICEGNKGIWIPN